jgi:metacaspase-1
MVRTTRADANIAAQATGAMSWAFITAMKKNPQQSYVQLLNSIRDELATKYTQKPQLSCSHPLSKFGDVSLAMLSGTDSVVQIPTYCL